MPKNKIEDLRDHLFMAMERLQEADDPEAIEREIKRAKAIADVARVGVDSAKAESEYINTIGARSGSGFIPDAPRGPALPGRGQAGGGQADD